MIATQKTLSSIISTDSMLKKRLTDEGEMDDELAKTVEDFLDSVAASGSRIISPSGRKTAEEILYAWSGQIRVRVDEGYLKPILQAPTDESAVDFGQLTAVKTGNKLTMLFKPTEAEVAGTVIALTRTGVIKLGQGDWGRMMNAQYGAWDGDDDRLLSATAGDHWSLIRFEEVLYALELFESQPCTKE